MEPKRREVVIEADDDLVPLGSRPLVGLFVPAAAGNESCCQNCRHTGSCVFFPFPDYRSPLEII